jgi:Leucine-rich repeat (LRR) protein
VVNQSPNSLFFPKNYTFTDTKRYFGVFTVASEQSDPSDSYNLSYAYGGDSEMSGHKDENRYRFSARPDASVSLWTDLQTVTDLDTEKNILTVYDQPMLTAYPSQEFIGGIVECPPAGKVETLEAKIDPCQKSGTKVKVRFQAKLSITEGLISLSFMYKADVDNADSRLDLKRKFTAKNTEIDTVLWLPPNIEWSYYAVIKNTCGNSTKGEKVKFITPAILGKNRIGKESNIVLGEFFEALVDQDTLPSTSNIDFLTVRWQESLSNTPKDWKDIPKVNSLTLKEIKPLQTTFYRRILQKNACSDTSNIIRIRVRQLSVKEERRSDSLVLKQLFDALGGENWNKKWDFSRPMEEWEGVNLDQDRVVAVSLWGNNLKGTIPFISTPIPMAIKYLNLSNNQLAGQFLTACQYYPDLEYLDLSNNNLKGAVPAEISLLKRLRTLNVGYNQLTALNKNMTSLVELRTLFVNNNLLSEIPEEITSLANLELLNLNNNRLIQLPDNLGKLLNLRRLYVANNEIGVLPASMVNLVQLEEFFAQNNHIRALPNFYLLNKLLELRLYANELDFGDLEPLMSLPNTVKVQYIPQAKVGLPQEKIGNIGENLLLSVVLDGSKNLYQWFRNNELISNAQSNPLLLKSLSRTDAGSYYLRISNSSVPGLVLLSEKIEVRVNCGILNESKIKLEGQTQYCAGEAVRAKLSILEQKGYEYQWLRNGTSLADANSSVFSPTSVGKYSILVKDPNDCSAISEEVELTEYPSVRLRLEQKENLLSFQIDGKGNLVSFQWLLNRRPIPLANQATYEAKQGGEYSLLAIDENGCMALTNSLNLILTGLEQEIAAETIRLYPNPNQGIFELETRQTRKEPKIYSAIGQSIKALTTPSDRGWRIDLSSEAAGVYWLETDSEKGKIRLSFVKE